MGRNVPSHNEKPHIMYHALIVDDHPAICFALKSFLTNNLQFEVNTAADGIRAMSMIKMQKTDIVLLDIALAKMDGMETLSRIKQFDSNIKVVILTGQPAEQYALRTLRAGAEGFISKDVDLTHIGLICQQIIDGYSYFPSFCVRTLANEPLDTSESAPLDKLSNREMAVLRYLIEGKSNKEIGELLLLSNKTISTYKTRLFEKTGCQNVDELKRLLGDPELTG
ncbi:response regulator transcription factor [[Pantoea] beijingensis]|nr:MULTISPECIES: response regulator transcription factor [Erwiniaceae]